MCYHMAGNSRIDTSFIHGCYYIDNTFKYIIKDISHFHYCVRFCCCCQCIQPLKSPITAHPVKTIVVKHYTCKMIEKFSPRRIRSNIDLIQDQQQSLVENKQITESSKVEQKTMSDSDKLNGILDMLHDIRGDLSTLKLKFKL